MNDNNKIKNVICTFRRGVILLPLSIVISQPVIAAESVEDFLKTSEWFGGLRLRAEGTHYSHDSDPDYGIIWLRVGAEIKVKEDLKVRFRLSTNSENNNTPYDVMGASGSVDFGYDQAFVTYTGLDNLTLQAGKMPSNYYTNSDLFREGTQIPEGASFTYHANSISVNVGHYIVDDTLHGAETDLEWNHLQFEYGTENVTVAVGGIALSKNESRRLGGEFAANEITTISTKVIMGKAFMHLDANVSNEDMDTDYDSQGLAITTTLGYHFNDKTAASLRLFQKGKYSTLANGEFTETNMHARENIRAIMLEGTHNISPGVSVTPRFIYS